MSTVSGERERAQIDSGLRATAEGLRHSGDGVHHHKRESIEARLNVVFAALTFTGW